MANKPKPACDCKATLSWFCASLIPQPWMQHPSHCPAVQCICGKQYWSMSKNKVFNSKQPKKQVANGN